MFNPEAGVARTAHDLGLGALASRREARFGREVLQYNSESSRWHPNQPPKQRPSWAHERLRDG
jgi:hypothetical protein